MNDLLWFLAVATDSEYLSLSDLVAWVDQQVLRLESPPSWLLDVCIAKTQEEALDPMLLAWNRHIESAGHNGPDDVSRHRLYLGFLYLRYERGDLTMTELLRLAGRYSDGSDCGIDCEALYLLLNEIDGSGTTIPSDHPLADRVTELFGPMAEPARQCLDLLPTEDP
jgi:hypothetical protein